MRVDWEHSFDGRPVCDRLEVVPFGARLIVRPRTGRRLGVSLAGITLLVALSSWGTCVSTSHPPLAWVFVVLVLVSPVGACALVLLLVLGHDLLCEPRLVFDCLSGRATYVERSMGFVLRSWTLQREECADVRVERGKVVRRKETASDWVWLLLAAIGVSGGHILQGGSEPERESVPVFGLLFVDSKGGNLLAHVTPARRDCAEVVTALQRALGFRRAESSD